MSDPSDDDVPSSGAAEQKPDLRVGTHRDLGVEITRDLTGSGRLARGDSSNMSKLSFSARGRPRAELDPELQALREPAAPASAAPASVPEAPAPPPAPDTEPPGLLERLRRRLGGD